MFKFILKTIFGRNQNMAAGPQEDPVPQINEAAGPQEDPVPQLNESAGPQEDPVPPLNEAAGPRVHPVPKPGVRRTRRSREEETEEETEEEEVETLLVKRQRTFRFLRPEPVDQSPTMTDRIGVLLKEKKALISLLLKLENKLQRARARRGEGRLLAKNMFLKKLVRDFSQYNEKLVGANEAMATKMKELEAQTRDMESDFMITFQSVQSRLVELTQANENLTRSKKDMAAKIQAMEVNACHCSALNACERPRAETHAQLSQTAMNMTPYSVELPRSPSCTPLPIDYDSDDSFNDDFNTDTDDSDQAQAEKQKRDESESRSKTTLVFSEIDDFFRRTSDHAQEAKQKRDEPEQSRPDNPNVSILDSFFLTKRSFPLDETIVVPPPSLLKVPRAPSTPATLKPSEVVFDYREQEKKQQKLSGLEEPEKTEQDLASNQPQAQAQAQAQGQKRKRKRDESEHSRSDNTPTDSIKDDFFQTKRSFPLDETIVVPPPSLSKVPRAPSTPATLKRTEVVHDLRKQDKRRRKLYGLEEPEYDPPQQ